MMLTGSTTKDVRRANRARLVRHLVLSDGGSRVAAAAATGLSAATVTSVVSELIGDSTLVETGQLQSEGGRPATTIALNPDAAIVFGADVSETEVVVESFDLRLQRTGRRSLPFTDRHIEPEAVSDFIAAAIDELRGGFPEGRAVLGLGLGVPGIVEHPLSDGDARTTIHADVLGWSSVSLSGLRSRLGFPVFIDNGAKTTTQAESWYGSARGTDHAIVVLIGDGAGAGIITDGRLYRGSSSSAGEWGHTKIATDGIRCRCGSRGCVETFVRASAVLQRWGGRDHEWAGRETQGIDALISAWRDGDDDAATALTDVVEHLGLALSNLVNLYNPQKIIVGGWFGDRIAADQLEELAAATRRFSLKQPGDEAVLERSSLGQEAATLGAATLALDRFIESGWPH